jgi:uncharacterized protein
MKLNAPPKATPPISQIFAKKCSAIFASVFAPAFAPGIAPPLTRALAPLILATLFSVIIGTTNVQAQDAAKPLDRKERASKQWADQAFRLYEQNKVAAAIKLYQRAADAGDLNSAYNLAVIRITDEDKRLPLRNALLYLKQAAKGNYGLAQHMLGSLHEQGRYVERSQKTAFEWFERAAKNKVKEAYSEVATQFYLGRGTKQDYAQAVFWYDKAAESGDSSAQYILASMYETGLGVAQDLSTALIWYTAAARQGDEAANAKAKDVVKRMAAVQPVETK